MFYYTHFIEKEGGGVSSFWRYEGRGFGFKKEMKEFTDSSDISKFGHTFFGQTDRQTDIQTLLFIGKLPYQKRYELYDNVLIIDAVKGSHLLL